MRTSSPVWRLLRSFSWQELRHHGLRHATAVLAVLLGVALAFSVQLINQSALSEFSAAVRAVNGQADVRLRAAHGLLDEALYAQVAQQPMVEVASPIIDLQVQAGEVAVHVIGMDALVALPLAPMWAPRLAQGVDPQTLFAPDTVLLNGLAQQRLHVQPGEVVKLKAGGRETAWRVIGSVPAAGGEALAMMDIASAQEAFGLLGRIHRIDVKLAHGATVRDLLGVLRLPPGVLAESGEDTGERVSSVSRAYRMNLTVMALVALFTGAFLVFSIMSLSVAKRQQQFALLGVLGLTARERLALVLAEAGAIGVVGSALGIAAGTGVAVLALKLSGGDLGGGYFPGIAPRLQWSGGAALVYGLLGVAVAMVGGWMPARAAQRLAPAQALKGLGDVARGHAGKAVGPALMLLGAALARMSPVHGVPLWAYVAVACLLIGGIACVPWVVGGFLAVTSSMGSGLRSAAWMLPIERARRMRHTATVATAGVVASLSLSVALTVMVASFRGSVLQWLDVILPGDLYVRALAPAPDKREGGEAVPLPSAVMDAVSHVPGVVRAAGVRLTKLALQADRPEVALIARPLGVSGAGEVPQGLPVVGETVPARPGHVPIYVSEAMVDLYGARPGTTLALPLVAGRPPVQAAVVAVWRDYARQQGAIVIDQADYRRWSGDTDVNDIALWLDQHAATMDVQARVREAVAREGVGADLIQFAEPRQVRETTLRIFDRSFAVTYWLQAVAIGIGLFGTAASFSAQVLARRKEFGLLSHLGFTRAQVLGIVAGEGAAFTTAGALLGLALGWAVSLVLVKVVNPQSFHWTMDMLLPWPRLLALCLSVVAAGTLTAAIAGRAAVGRDAIMAVKEDW